MSQYADTKWSEVRKLLKEMTLEELEEFMSTIEVLGRAKKASMLFESNENLQ
jgi:hypothetical protein